jgi:peptidoglycan hydrolase FlgJ
MEIQGVHAVSAQQTAANAANPKLASAAHEFEASLMKEFLKPLEHDSLFTEDKSGDLDDEEGSDNALMSFGSQAMATAISERGGFGIATLILNHFRTDPRAVSSGNAPSSQNPLRMVGLPITKVFDSAADEKEEGESGK